MGSSVCTDCVRVNNGRQARHCGAQAAPCALSVDADLEVGGRHPLLQPRRGKPKSCDEGCLPRLTPKFTSFWLRACWECPPVPLGEHLTVGWIISCPSVLLYFTTQGGGGGGESGLTGEVTPIS